MVVFPGHGTIAQTAGLENSPQRANALELARAGFVTLTVEPRGFGRLGAVEHLRLDAVARLMSRTWHGLLVQDGMRAIDYLLTRSEVDPARIGVAGLGIGGAHAMYTAALDARVQAAVVDGYLGRYLVDSLDQERCTCNDIPGILRCAEMGDVAALIAPRSVLYVNGRHDPGTNPYARQAWAIARHAYQVLGVPQRIRLVEPETTGCCFDNQLAIGWLCRRLEHCAARPAPTNSPKLPSFVAKQLTASPPAARARARGRPGGPRGRCCRRRTSPPSGRTGCARPAPAAR